MTALLPKAVTDCKDICRGAKCGSKCTHRQRRQSLYLKSHLEMSEKYRRSHGTGNIALFHTENQTTTESSHTGLQRRQSSASPLMTCLAVAPADRGCCQFSHQGVLRSGFFPLLCLSLCLPLTIVYCLSLICTSLATYCRKGHTRPPQMLPIFREANKPTAFPKHSSDCCLLQHPYKEVSLLLLNF